MKLNSKGEFQIQNNGFQMLGNVIERDLIFLPDMDLSIALMSSVKSNWS